MNDSGRSWPAGQSRITWSSTSVSHYPERPRGLRRSLTEEGLRAPHPRHSGRAGRAGQSAHKRAAPIQCRTEPGAARHPAEPPDGRAVTRLFEMGLDPVLLPRSKGGRKPINAKTETVARLPMFREAYIRRRCIVPVDGFFEWKAIKGRERSSHLPSQ
jgi:hypothetical protein